MVVGATELARAVVVGLEAAEVAATEVSAAAEVSAGAEVSAAVAAAEVVVAAEVAAAEVAAAEVAGEPEPEPLWVKSTQDSSIVTG